MWSPGVSPCANYGYILSPSRRRHACRPRRPRWSARRGMALGNRQRSLPPRDRAPSPSSPEKTAVIKTWDGQGQYRHCFGSVWEKKKKTVSLRVVSVGWKKDVSFFVSVLFMKNRFVSRKKEKVRMYKQKVKASCFYFLWFMNSSFFVSVWLVKNTCWIPNRCKVHFFSFSIPKFYDELFQLSFVEALQFKLRSTSVYR